MGDSVFLGNCSIFSGEDVLVVLQKHVGGPLTQLAQELRRKSGKIFGFFFETVTPQLGL